MGNALIFPGQGSQTVGMGKELAAQFPIAKRVFDEVDEALGEKLSAIIFEGPEADLTLTRNTQPALMATSIAMLRVLQNEKGLEVTQAVCAAGHSLGEYTALCATNAIPLSDTAKLLRLRGEAMQQAVPVGDGTMAAILGLDLDHVTDAINRCDAEGICEIANHNAQGQIVISGHVAKVEAVSNICREIGAKRAVLLPVSAPFHCSLMQPAAEIMKQALANQPIKQPVIDIISNITAKPVKEPSEIKRLLTAQVTGRVRWAGSVQMMADMGTSRYIEIGAGKVLAGLVKRIVKGSSVVSIGHASDLEKY
ncbi:MAG: ACP S-malonyltransferase [bacterium]